MLDRLHRHEAELPPELEELAGELRVAGLMTPTPQPSAARHTELRAAVVARQRELARAGAGGLRGVAMALAVAAGGGLVIASAADGGNPATFVVEVAREIRVPANRPGPAEGPAEPPAAVIGLRTEIREATAFESATPAPTRDAASVDQAASASVRVAETPTPAAVTGVRPSNADVKPANDRPPVVATDPAAAAEPTAVVTRSDPALSDTASAAPRTPIPANTPKPTPAMAASDVAPVTDAWPVTPTPSPTPGPNRTRDTAVSPVPLVQDEDETVTLDSTPDVR